MQSVDKMLRKKRLNPDEKADLPFPDAVRLISYLFKAYTYRIPLSHKNAYYICITYNNKYKIHINLPYNLAL